MKVEYTPEQRSVFPEVHALVGHYGLLRVAVALAGVVMRRRYRVAHRFQTDLPARMQRDIGLAPPAEPGNRRHL